MLKSLVLWISLEKPMPVLFIKVNNGVVACSCLQAAVSNSIDSSTKEKECRMRSIVVHQDKTKLCKNQAKIKEAGRNWPASFIIYQLLITGVLFQVRINSQLLARNREEQSFRTGCSLFLPCAQEFTKADQVLPSPAFPVQFPSSFI